MKFDIYHNLLSIKTQNNVHFTYKLVCGIHFPHTKISYRPSYPHNVRTERRRTRTAFGKVNAAEIVIEEACAVAVPCPDGRYGIRIYDGQDGDSISADGVEYFRAVFTERMEYYFYVRIFICDMLRYYFALASDSLRKSIFLIG